MEEEIILIKNKKKKKGRIKKIKKSNKKKIPITLITITLTKLHIDWNSKQMFYSILLFFPWSLHCYC